ncbi:MAG TPA: helix-turn-helix domain-containing protein [Micromonosporaceae bacterium]|jgi:AcrR family transcriptional regulator
MTDTTTQPGAAPLSGRRAQAARNDEVILAAARAVFLEDPAAPVSAVAERAGVGISALYRRYPSKEELLRTLCSDGLAAYTEAVRAALDSLAAGRDAWESFAAFMRRVVDAGSTSLTTRLAGTFRPSEQLYRDAILAEELNHQLVERLHAAGALRPDIEVADLGLILEQIASVRLGDERRTGALRHRYLALALDALRPGAGDALPGPAPTPEELAARWRV